MAMAAMAGSRVATLDSLRSFCGEYEVRGFVRKAVVGFVDRSHESFYALPVRCGKKKEKHLAGKLAKVQELVKVQRELVLLSQKASTEQRVHEPEDSIQIAISNPNVLERLIKNLEDLQAELESLNVKAKKKTSDSSSSASSSSSSSDNDMAKAVDMRALRKSKNSVKHTRAAVAFAGQNSASDNAGNSISVAPVETSSSATEVTLPPFLSAERNAAGFASTSDDVEEEEPAIVAQIRALCSTANSATREIYSRGPIELKDTPSGRVIVNTTSSLPSFVIPVSEEISTSGTIEVCTVGKCKRGGSQEILASLQERIPESSSISVASCKCMGKCKSAPNVRVKNGEGQTHLHSHVSMDDVDTLLEMHFGVQASASQISAMPLFFAAIDSGAAAA